MGDKKVGGTEEVPPTQPKTQHPEIDEARLIKTASSQNERPLQTIPATKMEINAGDRKWEEPDNVPPNPRSQHVQ